MNRTMTMLIGLNGKREDSQPSHSHSIRYRGKCAGYNEGIRRMTRKKTRSIASYRAASLKGARTRQQMQAARHEEMMKRLASVYERQPVRNWTLPNPWFDLVRK